MNFRASFLVAACAALISTTANAQGWHASILGGPTWSPHINIGGGTRKIDDGFNAGGRVGYDLDNWLGMSGFALDTDLFYTQSSFRGLNDRYSSLSLMENLTYRVNTGFSDVSLYGGGGIGAYRAMIDGPSLNGGSTVMGWQAIGGIEFPFTREARMFGEYRYQNAHDVNIGGVSGISNTSNNVSVGVKFDL